MMARHTSGTTGHVSKSAPDEKQIKRRWDSAKHVLTPTHAPKRHNEDQGTAHFVGKGREKELDERWLPAEFSEIVGPEAGHQDERQRRCENLVRADPDARQVPH